MSAGGYLDACGFIPASTGTGNFVVSSAVTGYQTPASAGAVNATVYSYRAESADKSQWEEGFGAYTVSGTTLARSTITANSSGGTTAINFSAAPNVYITAATADLQNASLLKSGTVPLAQLGFPIAQIPGVATNTAATSGNVGEVITSTVTTGSLTSGTPTQATSITLTPGDWDISAIVQWITSGGTSVTDWFSSISLTSASISAPITGSLLLHERVPASNDHSATQAHIPAQVLISTNTTYFMNVEAVFTVTAPSAIVILRARRMR